MRQGVYPGSFNPLTRAHLAIAESARDQVGLDKVVLVVSRVALAKEGVSRPRLTDRIEVLRRAADRRPWLDVEVTDAQLLADIADGFDALILGADKWEQLLDPGFYGGSADARDAALARLPLLAVVPRAGHRVPTHGVVLPIADALTSISSTGVRHGRWEWLAPEAASFDVETGAWSDPDRYGRWVAAQGD